jgi:hypothetical protein
METWAQGGSETTKNVDVAPVPYTQALRTWAGHGTGATCSACGTVIKVSEIEYEVEVYPAPGSDVLTLHFHLICYRNWTGRGLR